MLRVVAHFVLLMQIYCHIWLCAGFSSPNNCGSTGSNDNNVFSAQAYQRARALETSQVLDGSRLHFQILLVDSDNSKGRIAEGLLARVAEYNDAMFILFPSSATITSKMDRVDAAPRPEAVRVCEQLGLCPIKSAELGTAFDMSYLDENDLVLCLDDDIRSLILRSVPSQDADHYACKVRSLKDFLRPDFYTRMDKIDDNEKDDDLNVVKNIDRVNFPLLKMLESDLAELVSPFVDSIVDQNVEIDFSEVFQKAIIPEKLNMPSEPYLKLNREGTTAILNPSSWPLAQAALILAAAGVTRFCLATMDVQFEEAFQELLKSNIPVSSTNHNNMTWTELDEQLRRCNASVCGYFSPQQRRTRYEQYCQNLQQTPPSG